LAAGLFAGLIAGVAGEAYAQQKVLRMANWLPPVHHLSKTIPAWSKMIEQASGGTLAIELMKAPLAKPPGQYNLVKNGIADLAYSVVGFTPKRFHVFGGIEMPFMVANAESASAAHWDWYARSGFKDKEFHDARLVAVFTPAPHLYHSRKPLKSLADFKGLKVRAGGIGIAILKKLGAAPVFLPPPATTEAMHRGTIDASQFPWEGLLGFRLTKISGHHLVIPHGLYTSAFWVAMSNKTWNGLTAVQKKAMNTAGGLAGSRFIGSRWDAMENIGKQAATKNGNKIYTLSASDTAKLKQATAFVEQNWIKKVSASGADGKALLTDLRATVKKYEKLVMSK
jgi:TRAP-type C4-dicarboxylate transport system substrate-binding protein